VLRAFLGEVPADTVVVLDEAYGEFVTSSAQEDTSAWVAQHPTWWSCVAFSKIYGLAGLRIGYGRKLTGTWIVVWPGQDTSAVQRGLASRRLQRSNRCGSPDGVVERREKVARERDRMAAVLAELGIRSQPEPGEFHSSRRHRSWRSPPGGGQGLLAQGILVRSGYAMDCPGWMRVTVGEVGGGMIGS